MKKNVGGIDKSVRIIAGVALLVFALIGPAEYKMWGFIGLVPLLTGLINFCPIYPIFGINTCPMKNNKTT